MLMKLVVAFLTAGIALSGSTAMIRTDPAKALARARLIVVGTAGTTDITVTGATLASYTSVVLNAADGSSASQTGATMRMSNGARGQTAEVQFDLILADVVSGGTVTWNVATSSSTNTSVEVFSTNNPGAPQLVDRFEADGTAGQFTTNSSRLASAGTVSVSPIRPLVLAHYYPWYSLDGWQDPQFADRPAQPYSSDSPTDIDRQAGQAHSAGIDAFVVSWQGRTNISNDHRMRLVLDSVARAGMHACVYFETYIVNPTNDPNQPIDPATMVEWMEDAVDMYSGHPGYLRVDGRPVIFVYIAWRLTEAQWAAILASVRATGRNPLVIGDFNQSRLINLFEGEYQYINLSLSPADLLDMYRTEALRVRTFDLAAGGRRRIWVASVCPGYDDTLLVSRSSHSTVDRANGTVYDNQWRTAATMAADWVVISTWNEYFENTEIEPSARYGSAYLDQTRRWAATFKELERAPHASTGAF